jgi:ABC-type antimicrobial peptide transport system ATPase subunit
MVFRPPFSWVDPIERIGMKIIQTIILSKRSQVMAVFQNTFNEKQVKLET